MDGYLRVEGVAKRYGGATVLHGLSVAVARGEFVSLLGPSGCGKTTLLRIIAGLARADAGRVLLDGRDLGPLPPHRRNVGVVFQNYALFPHLDVANNVAFGLRARGTAKGEAAARVRQALAAVRLDHLAARSIGQLSGGQQQRVAMARALVVNPALILLDEPLSALDRKLRETMRTELRRTLREAGMTAIFVTHDQEEALALSDRIAVMNEGRIEQLDTPEAIYARPATPFVLDFVGQSTVLTGRVERAEGGVVRVRTALGLLRAPGTLAPGSAVSLAVRPEAMVLGDATAERENAAALSVTDRTFLGTSCLLHAATGTPEDRVLVQLPGPVAATVPAQEPVAVCWRVADTLVFPREAA